MTSPAETAAPAAPTTPAPSRLRASDADRAATVGLLQEAVGRGQLTPDEGSERMAAAFAAVHLSDLPALTADLPGPSPAPTPPGWRVLAHLAVAQLRATLADPATGRPDRARVAAAVVLAVLLVVAFGAVVAELFTADVGRGRFDR
ncbi:DUF1707 SHOCT-like domain-containing protein [Blastococcus sp. SYSU D00820]